MFGTLQASLVRGPTPQILVLLGSVHDHTAGTTLNLDCLGKIWVVWTPWPEQLHPVTTTKLYRGVSSTSGILRYTKLCTSGHNFLFVFCLVAHLRRGVTPRGLM